MCRYLWSWRSRAEWLQAPGKGKTARPKPLDGTVANVSVHAGNGAPSPDSVRGHPIPRRAFLRLANVISNEDFIAYLTRAALVWPSIEKLQPAFQRWRDFLAETGVVSLSPRHVDNDAKTNNLMSLLVNQASSVSDSAAKHHLRNMTAIRPWKV